MKSTFLSKRDTALLVKRIEASWPANIVPKIKTVKEYQIAGDELFYKFEEFTAVQVGKEKYILPYLGNVSLLDRFPSITVDMGAVRFVCNGAKVTRPGITAFDNFKKGNIVVIKDEVHNKPLAVGIALIDSDKAMEEEKGYIVQTLHYISDKIWEAIKLVNI
ncbi:MAG TPA: PUA domain-containing protein [Nitrososphaeraceae archaeon]|jgi:PUA domain protein|nr:PUA domain-containing protein [Nitrososphaeraceae archaeon]